MAEVRELGGVRTLLRDATDPPLDGETTATDLIGAAFAEGIVVVAVPVERLLSAFFQLRSGLAGAIAHPSSPTV